MFPMLFINEEHDKFIHRNKSSTGFYILPTDLYIKFYIFIFSPNGLIVFESTLFVERIIFYFSVLNYFLITGLWGL